MDQARWTAVDRYIADKLLSWDAALEATLKTSEAAGLPPIAVSPNQGKLLMLLARIQGARRILEIGTLGGYSTIWLARALPPAPEGHLVTLEADPKHAEVARRNIALAELSSLVDLRIGRALDTLPLIAAERRGHFDLTFIDADKANTAEYFRWALMLSRPGSVIVVDNVVRRGAVIDADSTDPDIQGMRRFNDLVAAEPRVSATAMQTVGCKGYDGFAVALVLAD